MDEASTSTFEVLQCPECPVKKIRTDSNAGHQDGRLLGSIKLTDQHETDLNHNVEDFAKKDSHLATHHGSNAQFVTDSDLVDFEVVAHVNLTESAISHESGLKVIKSCSSQPSPPLKETEASHNNIAISQEAEPPIQKKSTVKTSHPLSKMGGLVSTAEQDVFEPVVPKLPGKAYADLLIDRRFDSIRKNEEPASYLMYCLRFRANLSLVSKANGATEGRGRNARTRQAEASAGPPTISLYDTLLDLLLMYGVAGRVEIFRLLLERRNPIPLFLPDLDHHLSILSLVSKEIETNVNISLGDDKSLMRVAIISSRSKQRSQSTELLKEVFHIESFHREDRSKRSFTTQKLAAELGLGCTSDTSIQHYLVLHVVGEFEPIWDFILEFSDYLIVEDSPDDSIRFTQRKFIRNSTEKLKNLSIVIWEPSTEELFDENVEGDDFSYYSICSPVDTPLHNLLTQDVINERSRWKGKDLSTRKSLHEMKLPPKLQSLKCQVRSVQNTVDHMANFANLRDQAFVLQKSFAEQSQFESLKAQYRNDEMRKSEMDRQIKTLVQHRRLMAPLVEKHPLINLLIDLLHIPDSSARILSIRQLEKALSQRCATVLPSLRKEIDQLSGLFNELSQQKNDTTIREVKERLHDAKKRYNAAVVSTEHIWREMSHLYAADHSKYQSYPKLAAQHLIDGMCIELLDGDSNMINIPWIEATLKEVNRRLSKDKQPPRIFVLSIMGMQSSGKSTLLNIMFGIQMKTSVGQCTRGVNMQLIPVIDRQEYDYILLLDTEGTRAPEYWGLPGSEKRDNQMATVSILLADATIIVTNGENDAAVKEILPIVLLAYQGSELAEQKGGQKSSMLFFVYNRIDTREKDKLSNTLQALGSSLYDAFNTAYQLSGASGTGKNPPAPQSAEAQKNSTLFQRFRINASDSEVSDVRILGNIKKSFSPPDDVPDPAYGEALAEFRQHIHERVTGSTEWKNRTFPEFYSYLNLVWNCILSADFTLNFKTVVERAAYDMMNTEVKLCERHLSEEYKVKFKAIETEILANKADLLRSENIEIEEFRRQLANGVVTTKLELDKKVNDILAKPGREKWQVDYVELWKNFKKEQENHWNGYLEKFVDYQLKFDIWVDRYKKEMRKSIRDMFVDEKGRSLTEEQKNEMFHVLYKEILQKAKKQHPKVNVKERVNEVYRKSQVIRGLPTSVSDPKLEQEIDDTIHQLMGGFNEHRSKGMLNEAFNYAVESVRNFVAKMKGGNREHIKKVYEELFSQITAWLQDKNCYVDSIVDEVINITTSVVTSKQYLQNTELRQAHIFAKQLVVKYMTEAQSSWEQQNSVHAKLNGEASKKEMRAYFDQASQGVVDTQLFIVMLKSNLEKILPEAFEEEMILLSIDKISSKSWLLDPKSLFSYMDLELLNLIDEGKIGVALSKIKHSQKFYDEVMRNLIFNDCPDAETEWKSFSEQLKMIIESAAASSARVFTDRAGSFITEFHQLAFQSEFQDNFLAKKFTMDSDGYAGCDDEEADEFRKQIVSNLFQVVDDGSKSLKILKWKDQLIDKILARLRENRTEDGARPRCNVSCPLCSSLCILPFGHGSTKKHETFHQPRGLTGSSWVDDCWDKRIAGTLVSNSCCTAGYILFWYNGQWNSYNNFSLVFTDWMQPTFMEHLPLREYIFANYNENIAVKYQRKPCVDIPSGYYHNLDNIRLELQEKTGSRTDEPSNSGSAVAGESA